MASNFFKVIIDASSAKEAVRKAILSREQSVSLMNNIGNELCEAFKENFRRLDAEKSKYHHNFYTREGVDKTTYEVFGYGSGGQIIVSSYQMAHKLLGGVVSAKNARALTIPVSEKAKASSRGARDTVPDAKIGISKRGGAFLFTQRGKGKNKKIEVHYLLRKSVVHKPHSYVIPPDTVLQSALDKATKDFKL